MEAGIADGFLHGGTSLMTQIVFNRCQYDPSLFLACTWRKSEWCRGAW